MDDIFDSAFAHQDNLDDLNEAEMYDVPLTENDDEDTIDNSEDCGKVG